MVLLSAVFLNDRIGFRLVLALAAGFAGAVALSSNTSLSFHTISGPLAVVLAAFMYAIFSVGSKPLVKEYGALPTAIWVAVLGTVFALSLVSGSLVSQALALSTRGWFSVLYLALLSTVVANMILYTLISNRAVSRLSIQLYLVPIVSLVGGILLLSEGFSAFTFVGAGFLFAGVTLATYKH